LTNTIALCYISFPMAGARVQHRGNIPVGPLQWTCERAEAEFVFLADTLRKNLRQAGIEPDANGCFTTVEICRAIYGGLSEEKLRTQREITKRYQLENAITEGSYLDRKALTAAFSGIADAISSRIMSDHGLSREAKEDILRDLSSIPVVLASVARDQTRLPRGNGEHDENSSPSKKRRRARVPVQDQF
jgi:hypothetical protein